MNNAMPCRLCGTGTTLLFSKTVLGRHEARYHQCAACGLVQTQEPTWLEDAYAEVISAADTGAIARNQHACRVLTVFLNLAGAQRTPCLDWAGGHGVLTRMMRDNGFQFFWEDRYAKNLFAVGFDWRTDLGAPFAVTAFEVLEHLVHPLETMRAIASLNPRHIITSTQLYGGSAPDPGWRYLAPETGQHIAFYRRDTLERLGREAGYPHVIATPQWQLFSRESPPRFAWALAHLPGAPLYGLMRRGRASLTETDSTRLREERHAR
jgi:hypothetical protein